MVQIEGVDGPRPHRDNCAGDRTMRRGIVIRGARIVAIDRPNGAGEAHSLGLKSYVHGRRWRTLKRFYGREPMAWPTRWRTLRSTTS
jgi:hypothetical protein